MKCSGICNSILFNRYLSGKIKEGEAHNITCPGFDCIKLVPVEIIETLVSRDMSRRYLQFDIKVSGGSFDILLTGFSLGRTLTVSNYCAATIQVLQN